MPSERGIVLLRSAYAVTNSAAGRHAFRGIPNGLRSPDHAGGGIFHDGKSRGGPGDQIGALPHKVASRPGSL